MQMCMRQLFRPVATFARGSSSGGSGGGVDACAILAHVCGARRCLTTLWGNRVLDSENLPTPAEVAEGKASELAPFTTSVLRGNGDGVRALVAKGMENNIHSLSYDVLPRKGGSVSTQASEGHGAAGVGGLRAKPWQAAWLKVGSTL